MGESLRRITRLLGAGDDERAFPWHHLGFDEMQGIRDRLAAAYPPATANLSLSAMRQMVKIGHVRGLVTDAQRRAIDLVKNVRGGRLTKGRSLTDAELESLWAYACSVQGARGVQLRALLAVFVGAGLRREEVCGLLVSGCHGDELHVVGKGNEERAIPIDEGTSRQLADWIAGATADRPASRVRCSAPSDDQEHRPSRYGICGSPCARWPHAPALLTSVAGPHSRRTTSAGPSRLACSTRGSTCLRCSAFSATRTCPRRNATTSAARDNSRRSDAASRSSRSTRPRRRPVRCLRPTNEVP